jgi:Arc/MetJ-type ribon-helix-helix transcriptional regulator
MESAFARLTPSSSMRNHLRMTVRTTDRPRKGRVPTNLSLPRDLVSELDAIVGPRNRSAFVEEAIRYRLRREKLRQAIQQTAGAWKGKGPAEWDEQDGVVGWVRGLRAEETDPGPA